MRRSTISRSQTWTGRYSRRPRTAATAPYKGDASYYTVTVGIESAENAVWAYEEPL